MGELTTTSWGRLDRHIAGEGEDGVMNEVVSRVAEGESLKLIAQCMGITYGVLWAFLSDGDRMEKYRQAQEAAADALAHEVLSVADTSEVVRDKVEARKWLASKWGKRTYGDKTEQDGKVGITVIVQREGVSYGAG